MSDPERLPLGDEERYFLDIDCNATGADLLSAVGPRLHQPRDLSHGFEICQVYSDGKTRMFSPIESIAVNEGDTFHIQPAIRLDHACLVVLRMGDLVIDHRRFHLSSGQLNLSSDIPQNSFRSIAVKLVGGGDRLRRGLLIASVPTK
jgi:hypothetical protein